MRETSPTLVGIVKPLDTVRTGHPMDSSPFRCPRRMTRKSSSAERRLPCGGARAAGVHVWEPGMLPERPDDRWTAGFYADPATYDPTRTRDLCTDADLLAFVRECETAPGT
jgi:hypothetical protein